jgi:hypothetical protein
MIRIKCPKCSITLTLDDADAGQVGQCTSCKAKFRVPARKAAAPPPEDDEEDQEPAGRGREDEDEDDNDDMDEEQASSPKRRKAEGLSESARGTIVTSVIFFVVIVVLGTGGIFINQLAILVTLVSALLMLTCSLMVAREAMADGTGKFLMVWLIPLYFVYFVFSNWERTGRLFVPYVGFLLLVLASIGAYLLHEERVIQKRKDTKARIGLAVPAIVRVYREA